MRVGKDKIKHFLGGLAISILVTFVFTPMWGLIAAVIAGASKEAYDKASGKGKVEWLDFWATVAGGILGYIILIRL